MMGTFTIDEVKAAGRSEAIRIAIKILKKASLTTQETSIANTGNPAVKKASRSEIIRSAVRILKTAVLGGNTYAESIARRDSMNTQGQGIMGAPLKNFMGQAITPPAATPTAGATPKPSPVAASVLPKTPMTSRVRGLMPNPKPNKPASVTPTAAQSAYKGLLAGRR